MVLIVLGLALWSLSHLFKRIAPSFRAEMGDRAKGLVAAASFVGIVLMVFGYRGAEVVDIWYPSAAMRHVNNLLMLVSIYLFAASGMKTAIARKFRHPMLTGVIIWAVAHLLVNGDLASIILFGGMLVWAVLSIVMINRAEPEWNRPLPAPKGKEIGAAVGAVIVLGAIGFIHSLLGYPPFG